MDIFDDSQDDTLLNLGWQSLSELMKSDANVTDMVAQNHMARVVKRLPQGQALVMHTYPLAFLAQVCDSGIQSDVFQQLL